MKQVSSADFRKNYAKETDPVEVTAWGRVIGKWVPAGADIEVPPVDGQPTSLEPETETRMTIRPAKAEARRMVAVERRIADPAELRRLERERAAQG